MKKEENGVLLDVIIIRFTVVILLLFCHSFTIYGNGWKFPEGITEFTIYKIISQFANAAMIETFVFISGYVFQMQIEKGKIKDKSKIWILHKAKRLLIPSLIFSLIWMLSFKPINYDTILNIVIHMSTAHLWFLPMLFWCFICGYIIQKNNWYSYSTLCILLLLMLLPRPSIIPLRITCFMEYAFYFVLGMFLFKNRNILLPIIQNKISLIISFTVFITTFGFYYYINSILNIKMFYLLHYLLGFIYSTAGLIFIYGIHNFIIDHINSIPLIVKRVANYSFAIYVFHQFILYYIYFYTKAPIIFGQILLPWISIIITMILSYILAHLFLKTKIGKWLLG